MGDGMNIRLLMICLLVGLGYQQRVEPASVVLSAAVPAVGASREFISYFSQQNFTDFLAYAALPEAQSTTSLTLHVQFNGRFNELGVDDAQVLAGGLEKLVNLTSLTLYVGKNHLGDAGVSTLAASLAKQ